MSELTDLRRHAAALTSVLPAGPLEIHDLDVEPHNSPTSAIEARLISPSASALVLTRLPRRLLPAADRYLKFKLADVGLDTSASGAASVARWICSYVLLSITVEVAERRHVSYCVPVTARRSDDGWVARALIRPETWSNAASVTVVSISLAGRPLSKGLQVPATLQVGYNHAPAPAGAVLAAAEAGDVPALQAALVAGGSTEEADYGGWTPAFCASYNGHLEALRALIAAGANPATPDKGGVTPLYAAAEKGHAPVVALLLATPGVDPLALYYDLTPLDGALGSEPHATAALLKADPRVAARLRLSRRLAPGSRRHG